MNRLIILLPLLFIVFSCKNDTTAGMKDLSLLQYGAPITIKAPEGVEVKKSDLGVFQDITVKNDEGFYIQILASTATTLDVAAIKSSLMEDIKNSTYFSRILEEMEDGFIYEKKIDENNINYSFRRIKVMGDMEYIFQTGLVGKYTLEQVQSMYDAVD
jgi:hypothetical protein